MAGIKNQKSNRALSLIDEIDYSLLKILVLKGPVELKAVAAWGGTPIRGFRWHIKRMLMFGFIKKEGTILTITESGKLFYEAYKEIIEAYINERRQVARYQSSPKMLEARRFIEQWERSQSMKKNICN